MENGARAVGIASFVALLAAACLFDVTGVDFGWHLKSGWYIWTTRTIPTHDVFSYIAQGNRWLDSQWLFQLLLYGAYAGAGTAGVVCLRLGLVAATFALMLSTAYRREYWFVAIFVGVLALLICYGRFFDRPELLTFLFLAAIFHLAERSSENPRIALVGIPIAQALWANAHGLHILGIVLVSLFVAGEQLQAIAARRLPWIAAPTARDIRVHSAILALALLANLLNANGLDGIEYPFRLFRELRGEGALFEFLGELDPPLAPHMMRSPDVASYVSLLVLAALAQLAQLRRIRLAHALPLLAFAYLSTLANRNMALFAVIATPVTIRNLCGLLDDLATRRRPLPAVRRKGVAVAAAAAAAALAIGGWTLAAKDRLGPWLSIGPRTLGLGLSPHYPREVAPVALAARGNIFNSPDLGGYLIWILYPNKQVAVDGRWEVYGDDLYPVIGAFGDPAVFARLVAEHDVSTVILGRDALALEMRTWLGRSRDWKLVLHTRRADVFERRLEGSGG